MKNENESGPGGAGCCCRVGVGFPTLTLFMLLSVLSFSGCQKPTLTLTKKVLFRMMDNTLNYFNTFHLNCRYTFKKALHCKPYSNTIEKVCWEWRDGGTLEEEEEMISMMYLHPTYPSPTFLVHSIFLPPPKQNKYDFNQKVLFFKIREVV